jgi:hypothetical protein
VIVISKHLTPSYSLLITKNISRENSIARAVLYKPLLARGFAKENQFSHPSRTQHKSRIASQVHEGTLVVVRKECRRDVAEWKEIAAPFCPSPTQGFVAVTNLLSTASQLVELKKEMLPCGDCLSFHHRASGYQ